MSDKIKLGDMPAFPCELTWNNDGTIQGRQTANSSGICIGMTLRQYYAGLAMQGILAANPPINQTYEQTAEFAAFNADALLAELEKAP